MSVKAPVGLYKLPSVPDVPGEGACSCTRVRYSARNWSVFCFFECAQAGCALKSPVASIKARTHRTCRPIVISASRFSKCAPHNFVTHYFGAVDSFSVGAGDSDGLSMDAGFQANRRQYDSKVRVLNNERHWLV